MIVQEDIDRARIIHLRLENLLFESKDPNNDVTAYNQKTELGGILFDVNELAARLWKTWRDTR